MTTFATEYNKLSQIEKDKIVNYKNIVIKWVDGMNNGETMTFKDNPERNLIYFAANDVIELRIFGEYLTVKGYELKLQTPYGPTKGINIRKHYDKSN